jgi:hypothetical protein
VHSPGGIRAGARHQQRNSVNDAGRLVSDPAGGVIGIAIHTTANASVNSGDAKYSDISVTDGNRQEVAQYDS